MKLQRFSIVTCLVAGLLMSSLSFAPNAYADATIHVAPQGSGVTADGVYTQNGVALANTPAFLTVTGDNSTVYHIDQVKTDQGGRFHFEWTMPPQAPTGTYTVTVSIQGETKTSTFSYTSPSDVTPDDGNGSSYGDGIVNPVNDGDIRFTGELNGGQKQAVIYNDATGLIAAPQNGGINGYTLDRYKAQSVIYNASDDTKYLTISLPSMANSSYSYSHMVVPGVIINQMLTSFGQDAHLLVSSAIANYDLPLGSIHPSLLDTLKTKPNAALVLHWQQEPILLNTTNWTASLYAQNMSVLRPPITFQTSITYDGGQTIDLKDFGNHYIRYSIDLTGSYLRGNQAQSVQMKDPFSDGLMPVPSSLYRDAVGHAKLVITRTGNGTMLPVQGQRSFLDMSYDSTKSKVEYLASKLVISGRDANTFDPNAFLTRAEFSTLLVRALGIADKQGTNPFYDVPSSEWYTRYVSVGSSLGLISGYSTDSFMPYGAINREQMASLLARALAYVKPKPYVDATRVLAQVSDQSQISSWARDDVALTIQTGILPQNTNSVRPQAPATRAECADMLYNLLNYLKFL